MATTLSAPPQALLDTIAKSPPALQPDRLAELRQRVARVRELRQTVADLTQRITAANKEIQELTFKELPDSFQQLGILNLGLDAAGNLPAYDAEVKPFFHANIAADWLPDERDRGFNKLTEMGAEDLIKTVITIQLGRGEVTLARKVMTGLEKAKVAFEVKQDVPWASLTAWVKEQHTKQRREFSQGDLEAIGAKISTVVDVKPRKVKS